MQSAIESLLVMVMLYIAAQWIQRLVYRYSGKRGLYVTALVGVPVHELSHAIMALVSGLKITRLSLFSPDPQTGQLGSVHFSYDPTSFWQRLAIGLTAFAPLPGAGAVLYLIYTTTPWSRGGWESMVAGLIMLSTFIHGFPSTQDLRTSLQALPVVVLILIGYLLFLGFNRMGCCTA